MPCVLARKGYLALVFYSFRIAILLLKFFFSLYFIFSVPHQLSGKLNGIDLLQEDKGEAEGCLKTAQSMISAESKEQDETELKASEVFMNGSDLKSDEGSLSVTELKDSR